MTGLRHVLLSVVAATLALVLGVGLGAGPVAEDAAAERAAATTRLQDQVTRLQGQVGALQTGAARDTAAVKALAGPLTDGALADRSVLLVVTPGAREADTSAARDAIEAVGGTVTATLTLTKTYVDPAKAQSPLEDLSLRLVPPGVDFEDGALPIDRVGTVLARATVRSPDEDESAGTVDEDAAEVIAGLDELAAVKLDGRPGERAELAVMVTGPRMADEAVPALSGLLAALDRGSRGAVLTGPGDARAGYLRAVRDDESGELDDVSTVDSAGTALGSAALVLAIAEQVDGGQGNYGLGRSARRVVPRLTAD